MPAILTIRSNGSIRIEGEFTLLDDKGNAFDMQGKTATALCRCNQSANKPFCDGSHKTVGFISEVSFAPQPAL